MMPRAPNCSRPGLDHPSAAFLTPPVVPRFPPARQERGDELVGVGRFHGERCEGHGDGEGHVVGVGPRRCGAPVGRVRRVHPHGGLDQTAQLVVAGSALELDAQSVMGRALGTARVPGEGTVSLGFPLVFRVC